MKDIVAASNSLYENMKHHKGVMGTDIRDHFGKEIILLYLKESLENVPLEWEGFEVEIAYISNFKIL